MPPERPPINDENNRASTSTIHNQRTHVIPPILLPRPLAAPIFRDFGTSPNYLEDALHSLRNYRRHPLKEEEMSNFVRLRNAGNGCYANSVVTGLLSLSSFREGTESLQRSNVLNEIYKPIYLEGIQDLTTLRTLVTGTGGNLWSSNCQQDASEFLLAIIQALEENYGPPLRQQIFDHSVSTIGICQSNAQTNCPEEPLTEQPNPILMVDISEGYDLTECYNATISGRQMDPYFGQCICSGDSEVLFKRVDRIKAFPPSLIVQLKRFDSTGSKSEKPINAPLQWSPSSNSPPYYLRSATIHHGGGTFSGHYTTLVNLDGKFYMISDDQVFHLTEEAAEYWLSKAYLLFYDVSTQYSPVKKKSRTAVNVGARKPATQDLLSLIHI